MKTPFPSLLLLLLLPASLLAQTNVLRIYPLQAPVNKTIRISYERALSDKWSLSADLGYSWKHPFLGFILNRISDSTGFVDFMRTNVLVSGMDAGLQLRYYPGEKAPKGFYVAPYLRHQRTGGNFENLVLTPDVVGSLQVGLRRTAGGVMLGYQFLIQDRISIDWQIVGLGFTSYKANLVAEANLNTTGDFGQFVSKANNFIQNYNAIPLLPNVPVNIDLAGNRYEVTPGVASLSVRSGLAIGLAF